MPRAPEYPPCGVSIDTRRHYRDAERVEAAYEAAYEMRRDFFVECVRIGHDMPVPETGRLSGEWPLSAYLGECSAENQARLLTACAWAMRDRPAECIAALQEFVRAVAAEYAEDAA